MQQSTDGRARPIIPWTSKVGVLGGVGNLRGSSGFLGPLGYPSLVPAMPLTQYQLVVQEKQLIDGSLMKAVILAGGLGTRLSEETSTRPKPMVEIGGKPILWHIMKIYSAHGVNDFVICLGYKGYIIKEYFSNYFLHMSDVTLDIANNKMEVHQHQSEPWRITLIDTGDETQTGGRLKRAIRYVQSEPYFSLTYGDGVSDVDISALARQHEAAGKLATVTAVRPGGRFGTLGLDGDRVAAFQEKPHDEGGWINGGFFMLSPKVEGYIDGDDSIWERGPLERLTQEGQLQAYRHHGFWQPMDTLRDKNFLEGLWQKKQAPWRVW